jgi:hypothetical protein
MTLRPSQLQQAAIECIAYIETLTNIDTCRQLINTLNDARSPLRAANTNPGGHTGTSDPTPTAATHPTHADHALNTLTRFAKHTPAQLWTIRETTRTWTTTPTRQGATDTRPDPDLWCNNHLTRNKTCEPATHTTHPGTGHPMRLCRWCYDHAKRTSRLPTLEEIRLHDRGIRTTPTVTVRKPKRRR